ncbi:hypothetical protein FTX61_01310 [Nitriliruptoraceae bacterium ZYF776]|nr:hypothetical protein [Profundirhabdus halotolerans]
MLLLLVALLVGLPLLWTVSVGALRDLRRARALDPRSGCQAWVTVRRLPDRRYRCGTPTYAGTDRCRLHLATEVTATPRAAGPAPGHATDRRGVRHLDEPQAVGQAIVLARIGVPLAVATSVGLVALSVWAAVRTL